MSKKSKQQKIESKGCIQINIGGTKYTFNDVDVGSTSLNNISKTLVASERFKDLIKEIVASNPTDINELLTHEESTYSKVGDFAIGNNSANSLAAIARVDSSNSSISMIASLLKDNTDYNILFSDSITHSKVYIGHNRNFIVLNPEVMDTPDAAARTLAFVYTIEKAINLNSSVAKILSKYVRELDGTSFEDELSGLDEKTANRKLLILAQEHKDDPIIKKMFAELRQAINDELYVKLGARAVSALNNPEEISSVVDELKKAGFTAKGKYGAAFIKAYLESSNKTEEGNKVVDNFINREVEPYAIYNNYSTVSALQFKDTTTNINGNSYTNGFVIKVLNEIFTFDGHDIDESLFTYNSENIPDKFKAYYTAYKDDENRKRLLNDLINNEDQEFTELFSKDIKVTMSNIINSLYRQQNYGILNNDFTPVVEEVAVDNDYEVVPKNITLFDGNGGLNKFLKENKSKIVEVVLTDKYDSFATIGEKSDDKVLKIYINPNKELKDSDISNIRNAVTTQRGRTAGKINRLSWVVFKQKVPYTKSAKGNIITLFRRLNEDKTTIGRIYSTAVDDFSMDILKAALESDIPVNIYPNYYPTRVADYVITDYLKKELNASFSRPDISKDFDPAQNLSLEREMTIKVKNPNKKKGDILTVENTRTGKVYKKVVNKIYNFKFTGGSNEITSMYDVNLGAFRPGTVVSLLDEEGNSRKRINATIIGVTKDEYIVLTSNNETMLVDKNIIDTEAGAHPLYISDTRTIGEDTYFYNDMGMIKNGRITKGAEVYREYFSKELNEIFDSLYPNSESREIDFRNFLDTNYKSTFDFRTNIYYALDNYKEPTITMVDIFPKNYSNVNILKILSSSMSRSGINVKTMTGDELASVTGLKGISKIKAFVHNGIIFLNSDNCTEDSPIHELMHLLLAQFRVTNPNAYYEMLNQVPSLEEYSELRKTYDFLTPNDYAEEVLVHSLTNFFMGRIQDYGRIRLVADNMDLKSLASKVLEIDSKDMIWYRDMPNGDFLEQSLRELLISNNSKLLDNLTLGINEDETILNSRISNIKSKLVKDGNLEIICK